MSDKDYSLRDMDNFEIYLLPSGSKVIFIIYTAFEALYSNKEILMLTSFNSMRCLNSGNSPTDPSSNF